MIFLLYPEHEGFINDGKRQLKYPNAQWLLLAFTVALAITVVALFLMQPLISEKNTFQELQTHGISTTGTIIDHRTTSGKSTTYYVTYEFRYQPSGQSLKTYKREQSVSEPIYKLGDNAAVDVLFLPNDPTISRLSQTYVDDFMILVFRISILIAFIWPAADLRDYWRKKRFVEEGQILIGTLQSCTGGQRQGNYLVHTQYVFQSPEGKTVVGKQIDICNHLKNEQLPATAISVAVLYLNRRRYQIL